MKSLTRLALIALPVLAQALAPAAGRADLPTYVADSDILATTPGVDDGAVAAMFNPAQWGLLERPELSLWWSDTKLGPDHRDDLGFAFGRGLGFSYRRRMGPTPGGPRGVNDYQIGMGAGTRAGAFGMAYGFSGPGRSDFDRENFFSVGSIARPTRWASLSASGQFASETTQGVFDMGLRPLSDPRLLLFADYAVRDDQHWDDGSLSGGVGIRPIPGIEASAKWSEQDRFQLSLGVTINRSGFRTVSRYSSGDLGTTNFIARVNPPVRGADLEARVMGARRYLEMDLKGRAVYQSYRFGDKEALPLRGTLDAIQFAIDDPTVGGVALNLSGYEANLAMIWEVREKLLRLKRAGKKTVVYADRLGAGTYYLASAADRIIMDPQGSLTIPGVQISRTYVKDMLEKLGIGFEEWRHFKYKSAMEALSRRDMSDADREQLGAIARQAYEEAASAIAATGRVTRPNFDSTVNEEPYLSPRRLLELRWIDQIGRWEDVAEAARALSGKRVSLRAAGQVRRERWRADEAWGPTPTIALVYAVGECAMDHGIKGRESSKALKAFRKRSDVKAIVMRVDSPGGDPLPSDLVAHEMGAIVKSGKPLHVSQGRVAASGGYWISMNAPRISTSPFTVTGSIGVIGGWAWNEGFGGKLGLASDRVQVGKSADLAGGLTVPLLGLRIPERNLNEHERELAKRAILDLYDDFTARVAAARRLDVSRVREIAEGRVYLGRAAVDLKLVDRIATLDETVEEAKKNAGIPKGRRIRLEEYPKRGFIRLPGFLRGIAGGDGSATGGIREAALGGSPLDLAGGGLRNGSYEQSALLLLLANPGMPLLLTPPSLLPDEPPAR